MASVKELTKQAGMVFEGAIRRMDEGSAGEGRKTAVVEVVKILKGPSVFSKFAGREVNVQLHRSGELRPNFRAVFFTAGVSFGQSLVLREVGQPEEGRQGVEREVQEAVQESDDDKLLSRLNQAELVVAGTCVEVRPFEDKNSKKPVSEHDPDWWVCVIEVSSMEKGKGKTEKGKTVTEVATLFAHSTDIVWYRSPKFHKGVAGVWLLHRRDHLGKPVPGLVTDHPLDFHPLTRLDHVRALLKREPE